MNIRIRFLPAKALLAAVLLWSAAAQAALTSIADTPLIVATPSSVQPNLMFVLDDSGSMNFDFLPDHINGDGSPDPKICRSAGATSSTATGTFGAGCCTNNNESAACWTGAMTSWSRGHPPYLAASFNGLAYNPQVRYLPPVNYQGVSAANITNYTAVPNDYYGIQDTNSIDLTTQYPDLEWCTDTIYTDCLRNGNYVLPATVNAKAYTKAHATTGTGTGFKAMGAPEAAGAVAATFGPHYYTIVTNEYCTDIDLRTCQVGQSGAYTVPAPVRWCNTAANAIALTPAANSCQAIRTSAFTIPRYPTKYPDVVAGGSAYVPGAPSVAATPGTAAKITFTIATASCTSSKTGAIATLKVNGGTAIINGTISASSSSSTLAGNLKSAINAYTGTSGYSASSTGSTVTVTAPIATGTTSGSISYTTSVISPCTVTMTNTGFSGYVAPTDFIPAGNPTYAVAGVPAARFERVDILNIAGVTYPGGANRSDCLTDSSHLTCTYSEEMTNFANWWAYYHSRMQMMKSSATLAFNGVPTNYRVGYMTINNSQGSAFMNLSTFGASSTARQNWWNKLKAAKPNNSTPLRAALATVGRYFGGKYNGSSINSVTVIDPMQYSCQKNFLLLSTDGFWNETNDPVQLNGSSSIGDQDSGLDRPMKDGSSISNTLADTAAYYYNTDLRTGTTGATACKSGNTDESNKYLGNDVCGNAAIDPVQRMSTFTLGLGASGFMQFTSNYATAATGDFYAVTQGSTPSSTICNWQSSGSCTWPTPVSNTLTTIDDLWHAAINGHGSYFSATDPSTLYQGLSTALSNIDRTLGASASVTTSAPNITATNNQAFLSTFNSGDWTGELQSRRVGTSATDAGTISATPDWSAAPLIDAMSWPVSTAANARKIYTYSSSASNHRRDFDWSTLNATEQGYFAKSVMVGAGLMQFCSTGTACLTDAAQTAAAGKAVVDFIRGDRSNEGSTFVTSKYFRERVHVLGDIVNSEAVFVGLPTLHYSDTGYTAYKASSTITGRPDVVYVGANDGMLHAIRASDGVELWAYVPSAVMPNLYKLVDKGYANKHAFFVDGSPVVRDVYDGSQWRTVLIGSLAAGGRAYFAIDVTDPTNPAPLWEFTDNNLGLTFGKAEVAKLTNGTWVAMLPSGYNNVSPGDGVGRLYVLDAVTGAQVSGFSGGLSTGAGSTTTPSGLGQIRGWADNADIDNTAQRVYGGDGLGNVWRFDVNNNIGAAGTEAMALATLKAPNGTAQPITSRPELGLVGNYVMVYVGTGRYMGLADIGDSLQQSIYAIRDKLGSTGWGDPRLPANKFVQQSLTDSTCPANLVSCVPGTPVRSNGSPSPVNLGTNGGWYVDLPATYERDNTDPLLVSGVLIVNTNIIDNSKVCSVGGSSWQNYFDYATGGATADAQNVVSVFLGNAIATTPTVVVVNNEFHTVTTLSTGDRVVGQPPIKTPSTQARRASWRELPTE